MDMKIYTSMRNASDRMMSIRHLLIGVDIHYSILHRIYNDVNFKITFDNLSEQLIKDINEKNRKDT